MSKNVKVRKSNKVPQVEGAPVEQKKPSVAKLGAGKMAYIVVLFNKNGSSYLVDSKTKQIIFFETAEAVEVTLTKEVRQSLVNGGFSCFRVQEIEVL